MQSPLFFSDCDTISSRNDLNLKNFFPQSNIFHEKCGCSLNLIRLCSILRPQSLAPVEILFLNWGNLAHFSLSSCSLLTVIKRLSRGRECRKRDLASSLCVRRSHKCGGIWQNRERNKLGGEQVGAICLWGRNDVLLREGKWRESTMFSERKQVYERKELSLESPVFVYTIQQWQLGLRLIFIWSNRGSVLSHTQIHWLCPLHSWMFRFNCTLTNNDDKITEDILLSFLIPPAWNRWTFSVSMMACVELIWCCILFRLWEADSSHQWLFSYILTYQRLHL